MMISCREAMTELWDYLDGELPPERAAAIAEHLSMCARCYPQYRFEYGFLAALARQRTLDPGPSRDLVQQVRAAVLSHGTSLGEEAVRAAADARRETPRAATPLAPRGAALGARARVERWALAVLRVTLGAFLLLGIGRLLGGGGAPTLPTTLLRTVAGVEGVLAALVLIGAWRRWSYGAALAVHVGTLLLLWGQLRDPWGAALAGLPACGALATLYLLRDRDVWTLDAWLAMRRPWHLVSQRE